MKSVKTAGTSVERALGPYLDKNDVWWDFYGQHAPPWMVREKFQRAWKSYYKVMNVRNPWDAMVSLYFFGHRGVKEGAPALFSDFVDWNLTGSQPLNHGMFRLDKPFEDWADRYIRLEHIEEDFGKVLSDLGLPEIKLERHNISLGRPEGLHYSMMYTRALAERIGGVYSDTILKFGYKFEHWQNLPEYSKQSEM